MRTASFSIAFIVAVALAACSQNGNGGAGGAGPERYMGERPNVNASINGGTSSSTMLEQRIKEDSARGVTSGGGTTRY
ncbi:MAG: hypothetical protein JOY81_01160 [Alphaproteobacteria bacterium]|nr:hypothetical protein [Alphaproteobacteria bacterium]